MPDSRRHDKDIPAAQQRSERIFSQQDLWYFRTREGEQIGPFRYRSEAQSNLEQFMERLQQQLK